MAFWKRNNFGIVIAEDIGGHKKDGLVKSPECVLHGTKQQRVTTVLPSVSCLFEVSFHSLIDKTDKQEIKRKLLWGE